MSVLQPWLEKLSWKKQTVMLGAIRSPDNVHTLKLKALVIWIRNNIVQNADPMTGFLHAALDDLPLFEHMDREFERLTLHAAHHILLAMEVIGFDHPDEFTRMNAWKFYSDAVDAQHLNPETPAQYESRYTDNPSRTKGVS
jgi:hypothetical protein